MNPTGISNDVRMRDQVAVNTSNLPKLLDCGRSTAIEIGMRANARMVIGRRVLWNVGKIIAYMDSLSENESVNM